MKRHVLAATLFLASLGGGIWAGAFPSPAPPPSPPPPAPRSVGPSTAPATASTAASQPVAPDTIPWQAIIKQLGSDDFAQREAAQKELGRFTWRQLDFLRLASDAAGDPEVKARLAARVAAIEEDIAVNPPGLTVDLKNASLLDVADALGKGMGTKLDIWPPNGNGQNFVYTLQAKDKPFWEVFMALSRQHGLSLQDIGDNQMRLMAQGQNWQNGVIVGPVAIFPQSITRQRTVNLQAAKGQEISPESMSFSCQVVIDPRVHIVRYSNPVFTSIIDDAGNTLFQQPLPPDQPGNMWDISGRQLGVQGLGVNLQIPEKKGTRIVSAKGAIRFAVQTAQEQVEINDLEKKSGQSFDVAGVTVQLTRFSVQGDVNNPTISLTISETRNAAVVPGIRVNGIGNSPPATVTILDSTDRVVFTYTLRGGGMGTTIGGNGYTGPFKMRLSVATKSKEVSFPFELKDLPLP